MKKVPHNPEIVPQGVANKVLKRHHNYSNNLLKQGKITPFVVNGDRAPWVSLPEIAVNSVKSTGSILITMEITDPETVEEYSKCDSSFIVDDLIHGNLIKMCNVTSIKSNVTGEAEKWMKL